MSFDINVHIYIHQPGADETLAKLDKIAVDLSSLRNLTMTTQAEVTATLAAVLEQQKKTAAEIVAVQASVATLQSTIQALEDQLANAGTAVSPELAAAVQAVKDQAQVVDDLIPDAPV